MVGHRLVELLVEGGATAEWNIVTFCEERHLAYDRVGLSSFFSGATADELSLVKPGLKFDLPVLKFPQRLPIFKIAIRRSQDGRKDISTSKSTDTGRCNLHQLAPGETRGS